MASEKQILANKANSVKGGVKTEQGKYKSKMNALKHGYFRTEYTDYEKSEANEIIKQLNSEYSPITFEERFAVSQVADSYIRYIRAQKGEIEYIKSVLNPEIVEDAFDLSISGEVVVSEGYKPLLNTESVEKLVNIYLRYLIGAKNMLYRDLDRLNMVMERRKNGFVSQNDV